MSGQLPPSGSPGRASQATEAVPARGYEWDSGLAAVRRPRRTFRCPDCHGQAGSTSELRDHRAWCQGDALANVLLLEEVLARDGELTHEALVAEARRRTERPTRG